MKKSEDDHVADRKVGEEQDGAIFSRRRPPGRQRMYEKCRRASDDGLGMVALVIMHSGHCLRVRLHLHDETISDGVTISLRRKELERLRPTEQHRIFPVPRP